MKRGLIPVILILIVFMSYLVYSQTKGRFIIGNEPPYIVTNSFAIQDSATTWDNIVTIDTHDINTKLRFNVKDPNPDTLNVRLCIGTSADPSGVGDCNVVNYTFPVVAPGTHKPSSGAQLTYTYNTDPLGTLEGIPAIIEILQGDCSGSLCSKTYYTDVIINDGSEIKTFSYSFNILNNVPNIPSSLIPTETHNPLAILSWTATDADDGTIDKWPQDTLTYHIQVGSSYGNEDYLPDPSSSIPTATITNPIPWGIPQATQARTSVYTRIWSNDNLGIKSSNYETTLDLVDNLPQFVNIYLSDLGVTGSDSCIDFLPQNCFISPTTGEYSSVNINLTMQDLDADCSALTHNANVILCLVDASGIELCNPTNNADYSYQLSLYQQQGSSCNFSISIPLSDPRGIEFFKAPGIYKLYLNSSSQAGYSTNLWNYAWEYATLPAYLYSDAVFLGDRAEDGGDGIQLGQWNPGLSLTKLYNQGNIILGLGWSATDPELLGSTVGCTGGHTETCWDLSTSDDLQIDDDNNQGESSETLLVPENVPETPTTKTFQPSAGLQICDIITCDSGIDETLDTYFHIMPPTGLTPGTYETSFSLVFGPI